MADLAAARGSVESYKAELNRTAEVARGLMQERSALQSQLNEAKADLDEANDLLNESQEDNRRLQSEVLNARSALAKGDAERRVSEQITSEDFAGAVRSFIGYVSVVPVMGSAFSVMRPDERERYDEQLRTVEDWVKRARAAMNIISTEVYVDA